MLLQVSGLRLPISLFPVKWNLGAIDHAHAFIAYGFLQCRKEVPVRIYVLPSVYFIKEQHHRALESKKYSVRVNK